MVLVIVAPMATVMAPPEPPQEDGAQAEGPQQGVIEDARRRQRRRRAGVSLALAAVAVAGVVIALGADHGGSHRATEQLRSPHAGVTPRLQQPHLHEVRLLPALEQGWVGWCVAVDSGEGCASVPTRRTPIFGGSSSYSPHAGWDAVAVTTSRVAAITFNNIQVRTHYTGLPYGFRVARLQMPSHGVAGPPPMPPALTALDASGHRIAQQMPLDSGLPTTFWQRRGHAPPGPCRITARMRGLSPQWGHVATHLRSFNDIVGRAFESCADTEFYLHNWPLKVAILLDAGHPGRPPAPIPNMTPVAGTPDTFAAPGLVWHRSDDMTAKRLSNAWLVVAGGSGPAQRLKVLRHLQAQLSLH
jgi:hypothetical protein